jgi:hypothetical protein
MSQGIPVRQAVTAAVVAVFVTAGALFLENIYIADTDLRYPIMLLTKVLGAIVVIILAVRVGLLLVKEQVRKVAPQAQGGLQKLGAVLFVTLVSVLGGVFGVLSMSKSDVIELWPPAIVLVLFGLAAYGITYLWREWRLYRSWRRDR